jgi:D-sedoheptulose 7-phosphate isomerase
VKPRAESILADLLARYPALAACADDIAHAAEALMGAFRSGGRLLVAGNGGSAADALHIVGELLKSCTLPRPLPASEQAALRSAGPDGNRLASGLQGALPALSLAGEISLATAFANDADPELAMAQQVWGQGRAGDVFWGLSTSGNSANVVLAAQAARARGLTVLALTGADGGRLAGQADIAIRVPATVVYEVQELHLPVYHALCRMAEAEFFGDD